MKLMRWFGFIAMLAVIGLQPDRAQASHFRYGTMNWQPTGVPGEVKINFRVAFRRADPLYSNAQGGPFTGADGFPGVGDVFYDDVGFSILTFGDLDETNVLPFKVTSYNTEEDWMVAEMVDPNDPLFQTIGIKHSYFGPGPFTVMAPNCCRIANLNQRANIDYFLEMDVHLTTGNRSPVATQVPIVVAVKEGATATFPVPAIDGDGDVLQWRFSSDREAIGFGNPVPPPNTNPPNNPHPTEGSPPKMSIDPNTGIVTWNTLGLNTSNYWTVQFMVEDWTALPSQGGTLKGKVPVDFLLKIIPRTGQLPVCHIEPMGDIAVTVGASVTFTVTGTDGDPGEALDFAVSGLPNGATMTPALPLSGPSGTSSVFNWTPGFDDIGAYIVLYSITDQAGQQSLCFQKITVTAGALNQPPNIAISPLGPITVTVGDALTFSITGTDPDADDTVTLDVVSGMPAGATMTPALPLPGPASGVTSVFIWTPTQPGTVTLTYSATDNDGASDTQSITLIVKPQQPPVITINPSGPLFVTHNATVGFTVTGTDPNINDIVTLSVVSGMPAGATMTPALPASGPASGVNSNFSWTPNLLQLGQYEVFYSVTDNYGNQASQSIVINVVPGQSTPPVLTITPPGPITVLVNQPVTYLVDAVDVDPLDTITLTAPNGLPAGATMTPVLPVSGPGSSVSSTFNWTPPQGGVFTVLYTATDFLGAQATDSITINVIVPNNPPVADAGPDQTVHCAVPDGATVHLDGTGSFDPDQDSLTYVWTGSFGTRTGATVSVGLAVGTHTVVLTVTDPEGASDSDTMIAAILLDNTPPVITLLGDNPMTIECPNEYVEPGATVTDDCDPNPTLTISGEVDHHVPGSYTVTYTARDRFGNVATAARTVNVVDHTPPVITLHSAPMILSPVDHAYHTINIADCVVSVVDACAGPIDLSLVKIVKVSSDEPEDMVCQDDHGDDDDDDGHSRSKGNNGLGNGLDPQPPGNPPINDGPDSRHHNRSGDDDDDDGNGSGGCPCSCHDDDDDDGDRSKGNNGLGNGYDPQPPGNPPVNDGAGQVPGNPGNRYRRGGAKSPSPLVLAGVGLKNNGKGGAGAPDPKSGKSGDDDDDANSGAKSGKSGGSKSGNSSKGNNGSKSGSGGSHSGSSSGGGSSGGSHSGDDDDDDGHSGGSSGGSHNGDDDDDEGHSGGSGDDDDDDGHSGGNDDDDGHSDDDDDGGTCCNDTDGQTLNDMIIATNAGSVQLRAEHKTDGNGRVYTITMQVSDPSGNVTTAECRVHVPTSGQVAIDDGPAAGYTVYAGGTLTSASRPQSGLKLALNEAAAVSDEDAEDSSTSPAVESITEIAPKPVVPTTFALKSNYPNPFNPSTSIAYDVPQQAHITLEVYNMLGQVVTRLVDEFKPAGSYTVTWNGLNAQGQNVASGIYIYRIVTSAGFSEARRMTLLK